MPESPYIESFRAAGIRVIAGGFRARFDRDAIGCLRSELGRVDYDIVHLLHNKPVSNGLRALAAFPKPRVIVYRGIVGNVSVWSPLSWLRYLHPRIDRVVCVAEAVRQYFVRQRAPWYRPSPERFVTIHKGHEVSWYETVPADLRQYDLPPGAFVVGCVTNLRPRKGVRVLVEAFALLPQDLPILVLLVGNMDSRRLDRVVGSNPNAARIRRLGFQRSAPAIIAACDVSVLPTLRREGLPKTVIEAMAAGVPPIVTDVGGSPELVEHGRSGLVVPPGDARALADAILTLYHDPALRERMGDAARQRLAVEFTNAETVARTLALYRDVLGEPEGRPA
jgi:glycosyltransferase involved in cell wall biosynthesis